MRTTTALVPASVLALSFFACAGTADESDMTPTGVAAAPSASNTAGVGQTPGGGATQAPTPQTPAGGATPQPGAAATLPPATPGTPAQTPGTPTLEPAGEPPVDPGPAGTEPTPALPGPDDMGAGGMPAPADTGAGDTPAPDDTGAGGTPAPDDMGTGGMMNDMPDPTPVGDGTRSEGPCDIYGAAGNECVAAYSTIRALKLDYDGPLYQVRSGSNAQNTGMGGELHDIGQTADGFADAAAQDAVCGGTLCTIAKLYDQSGRGNDLTVAKRGRADGGEFGDDDDFESIADDGGMTVGGHQVYSLYMEARQGYRQTIKGDGMPRGREAQGIYMLADGTHVGNACCWDFGNVTETPTQYHTMNTLFFGTAFWGRGAGNGPWFGADFEAGVWMGGSNAGDPGWGELETARNAPANDKNPSMRVPYALGFLKTDTNYALRMADLETANELTTAYEGPLPKPMDNQGAVVIGVGGDNSNNSWGTFYEGAVVLGYPSADTELAVMQNVKAAGYGQ